MRWQTRKRIWAIYRTVWFWLPDIADNRPDTWSLAWGCLGIEWLSREWLDYCERKGCGLVGMMEWIKSRSEEE